MKYFDPKDLKFDIKADYAKALIFTAEDLKTPGQGLQIVTVPANTKQREHYHHKQTEVFYVTKGECSLFLNGEEFICKPGDAFICEPGDKHCLWNKSDTEFSLLVFKINKPTDNDDTVWLE